MDIPFSLNAEMLTFAIVNNKKEVAGVSVAQSEDLSATNSIDQLIDRDYDEQDKQGDDDSIDADTHDDDERTGVGDQEYHDRQQEP